MSTARARAATAFAWLALGSPLPSASAADLHLEVAPLEATVGDPLTATLTLELPADSRWQPEPIEPDLGPFSVESGSWSAPESTAVATIWTWNGSLVVFEPGEHEVPAIRVRLTDPEGGLETATTQPLTVVIRSTLEGEESPELSDLKDPFGLPPSYRALIRWLSVLAVLLLVAGLVWWLYRRYAARLAAVPAPDDPFSRVPPHEWVYDELRKLLESRWVERGEVDRFYEELSLIVKRYLTGRFRVELMERTSAEVPAALREARTPHPAIASIDSLLADCDRVKFAGAQPDSGSCRASIEEAYRIVDATKPAPMPSEPADRGAA